MLDKIEKKEVLKGLKEIINKVKKAKDIREVNFDIEYCFDKILYCGLVTNHLNGKIKISFDITIFNKKKRFPKLK